jgi:hypothetical protein
VLFVPRRQGRLVLEEIAANGGIAVGFSQPSRHRTVQLKGRDARIVPLEAGDRALALACRDALSADLQRVGYPPTLARAARRPRRGRRRRGLHARRRLRCDAPSACRHVAEGRRVSAAPAPDASPVALDAIRECLEGTILATMTTCAREGTPNITYLSQIQYVDPDHVGLSFQSFTKTRANVLATPWAEALTVHPYTAAIYRLELHYLRTETEGALFETIKAKLARVASAHGMAGVFRLRGADAYRVEAVGRVTHGDPAMPVPPRCTRPLAGLRRASLRIAAAADLDARLDETLAAIDEAFGFDHSMLLLLDRLFTVASRGYPSSGAGSEVPMGSDVIGTAARERTPIRINHATAEYACLRAVGESIERAGDIDRLETLIQPSGLRRAHSPLAVPMSPRARCSACSRSRARGTCASATTTRTRWSRSPRRSARRCRCCSRSTPARARASGSSTGRPRPGVRASATTRRSRRRCPSAGSTARSTRSTPSARCRGSRRAGRGPKGLRRTRTASSA